MPAACPRLPGAAGDLPAISTARTVNGPTLGENLDGAEVYNEDVIRPLDRPLQAEGGVAVLRGNLAPRRRRHQDQRRRSAPAEPYRPGGGVRRLQRHGRRHRRPGPEVTADSRAGPAQRRPAGRPRHAGVGHAADPEEAAQAGRARHGAHFRRPHERHQLRHLRPACGARVACRRAAGAGAERRSDRAGRAGPQPRPAGRRGRAGPPPRRAGSRRRRATSAATGRCSPAARHARPTRAATSTSWKPERRRPSRKFTREGRNFLYTIML